MPLHGACRLGVLVDRVGCERLFLGWLAEQTAPVRARLAS